jgi:hypothetical protein
MATNRIGNPPGRGSWLRFTKKVSVKRLSGIDIVNPVEIRWLETFDAPVLEARNGDIDYIIESTDRIDRLANRFYNDTTLWWVIALRNAIDEPAVGLHSGEQIVIPSPAWVKTSLSGRGQGRR